MTKLDFKALRGEFGSDAIRDIAAKADNSELALKFELIAMVYDGLTPAAAARKAGVSVLDAEEWISVFVSNGPAGLGYANAPLKHASVVKPSAEELRLMASKTKDLLLGRRMMAIAGLLDGGKPNEVGARYGMMPLSLSNFRKRFDELGVEGLSRWQSAGIAVAAAPEQAAKSYRRNKASVGSQAVSASL